MTTRAPRTTGIRRPTPGRTLTLGPDGKPLDKNVDRVRGLEGTRYDDTTKLTALAALVAAGVVGVGRRPLLAHHSGAMFDNQKTVGAHGHGEGVPVDESARLDSGEADEVPV